MRRIVILVIACVAVLCLAGVIAAFALAPKPSTSASTRSTDLPSTLPTNLDTANPTATPAAPGTQFTTDATLGDIPTWISPASELSRAHSIHVWLATAKCMQKLGYADFHYRVYWMPGAVTRGSENFWTNGMSSAEANKALTDEFGPTLISESSSGCHGRALVALQHEYLDGR
jgi:hypothetical protein